MLPQRIRRTAAGLTLPRTDGRSRRSRRFRDLCEAFERELGGNLNAVDQNLVRQAANMVLASENFQLDVINGADVNPDALVRVSSEARRILGMLRAKATKAKPSGDAALKEYLARNYPRNAEASD